MATIYKHGELGQIERLTHKVCYCADGKILKNYGHGWKVWGKVKPGIDPKAHFEKCKAKYAEKLATMPAFAAWRKALHDNFSLKNRVLALESIKMLGDDFDGAWASLDDYGIKVNFDDFMLVCEAYKAACNEARIFEQNKIDNNAGLA